MDAHIHEMTKKLAKTIKIFGFEIFFGISSANYKELSRSIPMNKNNKKTKSKYSDYGKTMAALAVIIMVCAVIFLNLFTHVLSVVRYYGDGMEPALKNGQTLIVLRTENVKAGDKVAFYYNNQLLVRRVICEGEHQVAIKDNGDVLIDSVLYEEDYVENKSIGQCNIDFPYYVMPDHYFVMGDNRTVAMDSRLKEIGAISGDRIMGKVILAF